MVPRAFLNLANQLSKNRTCEASLRSCVSRCYYALFNSMTQFIESHVEELTHTATDHKKVYYYLNHCEIEEVEEIASNLNDLRDERNDSDYKLHLDKFTDNYAVIIFLKAKTAFDSFERILGNSKQRRAIVKGIRKYKHRTRP